MGHVDECACGATLLRCHIITSGPRTDGMLLLKAESNEDAEVFALRTEFERLIAARNPLAGAADGLGTTFNAMVRDKGYDAVTAWNKKVNLDPMLEALEALNVHADRIAEAMIALEPKTPRAIAAVAATLKEDGLGDYWDEPDEDTDWSKMLVTRFLDALIAGGSRRANTDADRTPA